MKLVGEGYPASMTVVIVTRKKEELSRLDGEGEEKFELMPDEGVGCIDVGISPIEIPRNEVKVFVEDGIVAGRAQMVMKETSKTRPRGCDAVKFPNGRKIEQRLLGANRGPKVTCRGRKVPRIVANEERDAGGGMKIVGIVPKVFERQQATRNG